MATWPDDLIATTAARRDARQRMNETWPKSPDLLLMKAEAAKAMEMR